MLCNLFSTISTRKSAARPTTYVQPQAQARPDELHPAPLERPSRLRGALRSVLQVFHLRRSNPKNDQLSQDHQVYQTTTATTPLQHPSTRTQDPKLVSTSSVPLSAATPSTAASLAALADISPLFAPQPAESAITPTTTFSCPSAFPSPLAALDLISTKEMIANLESAVSGLERQGAHQARTHKLDNTDAKAKARRRGEDRSARERESRKKVEEWMLQQRDPRCDVEDAAGEVLRHLEKAKKKKKGLKKKILRVDLGGGSDCLTPDEALQGLGLVDVSGEEACHSSGYDKRGRGLSNAPRPGSRVWFKNGRDLLGPHGY
ncbi:hypothetical protein FRC04_004598 [Tulasnella sp. 424]|nr:hypothetical protein FRC04_004598 [Tulasnella sp. 424]